MKTICTIKSDKHGLEAYQINQADLEPLRNWFQTRAMRVDAQTNEILQGAPGVEYDNNPEELGTVETGEADSKKEDAVFSIDESADDQTTKGGE
jgi:hypothetical protein